MAYVGHLLNVHWPYHVSLIGALGVVFHHYQLIKHREEARCFKAFLHNNWLGAVLFVGILMNYYV